MDEHEYRWATGDVRPAPTTLTIDGLYRVWAGANYLLASCNYTSGKGSFLLVTDGDCEEPMGNSETYSVGLYCGHDEPGSESILEWAFDSADGVRALVCSLLGGF